VVKSLVALLVQQGCVVVEKGGAVLVQVAQGVHRLPQNGPHPEAETGRDAVHQRESRQLSAVVDDHLSNLFLDMIKMTHYLHSKFLC